MSLNDKIICEITKSVRLIDNEFSSIKKLLLILDNDVCNEFNTIVDAFSAFYVNRLSFNHSLKNSSKNSDEIEIDMGASLNSSVTPSNTPLLAPSTTLPNQISNLTTDQVEFEKKIKLLMTDPAEQKKPQEQLMTDPAELELKIAEEMRAIIDSRRANLKKTELEPPYVAPIQFRESVAGEITDTPTAPCSSAANALLKLLSNTHSTMDTPTIEEEGEIIEEEVIYDGEDVEDVREVEKEVETLEKVEEKVNLNERVLPDIKTFSPRVELPPIPRSYMVPPVKFTTPDKLPESHPQIAPLFRLSLHQRNRLFERFYKTAKLTVEELNKDLETQPTEDEKNKMIRDECDKMLEDYLAGGADTLEQTEL